MKRFLITCLMAVALVVMPVSGVFAATTADVIITATPSYISITNAPATWAIGVVTADTDVSTATDYFTITNGSTVVTDISMQVTNSWNFTSGSNNWSYGAAAENTGRLLVSAGTGSFNGTLATGSPFVVIDDLAALTPDSWEMRLDAPTSFTHGDPQEITVTITAAAG